MVQPGAFGESGRRRDAVLRRDRGLSRESATGDEAGKREGCAGDDRDAVRPLFVGALFVPWSEVRTGGS